LIERRNERGDLPFLPVHHASQSATRTLRRRYETYRL
jgi:hypothetical protein